MPLTPSAKWNEDGNSNVHCLVFGKVWGPFLSLVKAAVAAADHAKADHGKTLVYSVEEDTRDVTLVPGTNWTQAQAERDAANHYSDYILVPPRSWREPTQADVDAEKGFTDAN
ncbi:MAG: hypothetical protein ACRC7O_02250 [Fimbriiglobus sp.]